MLENKINMVPTHPELTVHQESLTVNQKLQESDQHYDKGGTEMLWDCLAEGGWEGESREGF